jgi:hypothetical protein
MSVRNMRAAEVGWSLFQTEDGNRSLDEINQELARRELPGISPRMYDHYGRLVRHGFSTYAPINELDMFIKSQRQQRKSA